MFRLDRPEINSENYRVILRAGGKSLNILLRRYKNLSDLDQIFFYLSLLDDLIKLKVLVSPAIINLAGKPATKIGKNIFTLFKFIEGEYFSPTREAFASAARAIAEMHAGFNRLEPEKASKINFVSKQTGAYYNKIKKYSGADFNGIARIIENKKMKTAIDKEVLKNRRRFVDIAAGVNGSQDKIQSLPKQIIHSDLHPHNLLFEGGEVRAILDFDAVRISEQARDVAFAIYRFGRQFLINKSANEAKILAPMLRESFLKNYYSVKGFSTAEIDLMPVLLKDEFTRKLLFVLKSVYLENNLTWSKDLPKFIAAFEEIDYFWPD